MESDMETVRSRPIPAAQSRPASEFDMRCAIRRFLAISAATLGVSPARVMQAGA
jgi:hypothetical protein